jgi:hypothetical protein
MSTGDFATDLAAGQASENRVLALLGGSLTTPAERHHGDLVTPGGVMVEVKRDTYAEKMGAHFIEFADIDGDRFWVTGVLKHLVLHPGTVFVLDTGDRLLAYEPGEVVRYIGAHPGLRIRVTRQNAWARTLGVIVPLVEEVFRPVEEGSSPGWWCSAVVLRWGVSGGQCG